VNQSNLRAIQQADNAGKTKLTAVTIGHGHHRRQFFVMLEHDSRGAAKLPHHVLDRLLSQAGVRHGDTYTVS
jgi:hypothetical protein